MKALALLFLTLPAFAQTPAAETPPQPLREINFETPDEVNGRGQDPELDQIQARQRLRAHSLIRIRTDFQPEMLRSVEDI